MADKIQHLFDCLITASDASSRASFALEMFLKEGGDLERAAEMAGKLSSVEARLAAQIRVMKTLVCGGAPRITDG